MPKYNVKEFFTTKRVTPSAIQQDNLLQFSYKSPNGVHDKQPLVYVVGKELDRFYGLNLHYDSTQLVQLLEAQNNKVDQFLEKEFFRKYPKKKKELKESRQYFYRGLLEAKDFKDFTRRIRPIDLEQFYLQPQNTDIFRCYLYKRCTAVSKMIYKVIQ